jgi:hypothetical protein
VKYIILIISFGYVAVASVMALETTDASASSIALSAEAIIVGYVVLIAFFGTWVRDMDKKRSEDVSALHKKHDEFQKEITQELQDIKIKLGTLDCSNCGGTK